jgi:hypothetical protein
MFCSTVFAYRDGTIIIVENQVLSRIIARQTGSPYNFNHSAIILHDANGYPWVYESTWPVVKRTPLWQFQQWARKVAQRRAVLRRGGLGVYYIEPKYPYTEYQLQQMKAYAKSQLGRRYMMRGWWKNREVRGIHCSQYVGNILEESGRLPSMNFKESPYSIYCKAHAM